MLPERLSTDLTSLNEGEDRLAVVIEFDVAADGALANPSVYRALVHNKAKLVYDDVGMWLDGKGPTPRAIAASREMDDQLRMQDEAARRLRKARSVAGALDFESVEARPVVVNGKVVDLAVDRRNRARDMIEDFMVAANRSVATYLLERGSPSLRRVVREPKRWDRIVALAADVGEMLPRKTRQRLPQRIPRAPPRRRSRAFRRFVALRRQAPRPRHLRSRASPGRSQGGRALRSRRRRLRALHRSESPLCGSRDAADASRRGVRRNTTLLPRRADRDRESLHRARRGGAKGRAHDAQSGRSVDAGRARGRELRGDRDGVVAEGDLRAGAESSGGRPNRARRTRARCR